jgi:hypothetical protein
MILPGAGIGARRFGGWGWRGQGWGLAGGPRRMRLGRQEALGVPWQPVVQVGFARETVPQVLNRLPENFSGQIAMKGAGAEARVLY